MKGAFPPQRPALYAKVCPFLLTLLFKTVRNFSVNVEHLRQKAIERRSLIRRTIKFHLGISLDII